MSNNILTMKGGIPSHNVAGQSSSLVVTATVQGKYGAAIQLTMDSDFIVLAENQVRKLIELLQKRLDFADGFTATDTAAFNNECEPVVGDGK